MLGPALLLGDTQALTLCACRCGLLCEFQRQYVCRLAYFKYLLKIVCVCCLYLCVYIIRMQYL